MTKALVPECPPILDPEIDLNKGRRSFDQAIYRLGRHFNSDKSKVKKAMEQAEKAHLAYRKEMSDRGITPIQALNKMHPD